MFGFIPFEKIPPGGAAGDNTAYFQRKKLFSEAKVLETMKLVVELGGEVNGARGPLVTYHVGNSRTLVGRDSELDDFRVAFNRLAARQFAPND